jgi:exopolysaccharide production protein ExoZ
MRYRNIQGLRAIAAMLVFCSHLFWDIVPMRTHWARPLVGGFGRSGVDIFFVISGFIIYHAVQRSAAQVAMVGRAQAAYEFAMKRIIRIYPLYWIVFAAAAIIMIWVPLTAPVPRMPQLELLSLIGNIPNFRISVTWTLTFEVYFYAVAALSIFLFPTRIFTGLHIWFAVIVGVVVASTVFGASIPLDYIFAPIVLEFLLGMAIGFLIDRGEHRFPFVAIGVGLVWFVAGTYPLDQDGGRPALSYLLRLICWGMPSALIVYGMVALEMRKSWVMPKFLQYLGDASFSIYLWHTVLFYGIAALFVQLGWVGVVNRSLLTLLMAVIALGGALLSYHFLEKPLLRILGKRIASRKTSGESRMRVGAARNARYR